jgi:Flp pilus assembly protein TadD
VKDGKMKIRSKLLIGLSAVAAGGTLAAGIATQGLALSAFATEAPNAKKAAQEAGEARKAIAKRKGAEAVKHAEIAVANDPQNAEYRALLGQAYLLAGRFASASQALNDALTLNPEDGRVALNLALAKIAGGDWGGAREMLQTHADQIPAADRGLAFALAGDPVTAIQILGPAARAEDATAKTRQNLALALALSGRWSEAKEVASVDVSPDQIGDRMLQWVAFARPTNAYDQVASLLGVTAVQDAGQPAQLALAQQTRMFAAAAPAPVDPVQAAAVDSVDNYMPGVPGEAAKVAAASDVAVPAAAEAPVEVAGTGGQVVFGPREEVVQAIPARAEPQPRAVSRVAEVATRPSSGRWYVQLGAYANAGVARDAWGRFGTRVAALQGRVPHGARISTRAGSFYRLSVGGFARQDADSLCRQVKAKGQGCFVRAAAGDAMAAWVKPGRAEVASR